MFGELSELFGTSKPIIGVIHLLPLPGSPRWEGQLEPVCLRAEQEAAALGSGGVNGIIIENFFDTPFTKGRVDTATACALALVVKRVMAICQLPIGVNVLRSDGLTALAVAATTGCRFIRVNVYTGAMLTDQGIIEGQANELQHYRKQLGAQKQISIFADILVKHATPLGQEADIRLIAKDTVNRGLADALIVTGTATGEPPSVVDLGAVREAVPQTPVLIGSGATKENIKSLLDIADGAIVASSLKRQGDIENPIDVERVRALTSQLKSERAVLR